MVTGLERLTTTTLKPELLTKELEDLQLTPSVSAAVEEAVC